MTEPKMTVYQAEWCPFSSRVRETLTELGVPWLAVPVPADKEDREEMREQVGTDSIPTVVLADGTVLGGDTEEIIRELEGRFGADTAFAEAHRRQDAAH